MHCDLKHPDADVGGGATCIAAEWTGSEAAAIKAVLDRVAEYPFCDKYRYWPGPNSNTFAAWVLRKARVKHALGPMALGKRFPVA